MSKSLDLTKGNIPRGLMGFAIPIIATNFIQTAYNLVDMIWIGKLGSGAVAAVGTATFFVSLALSLSELIATGSAVRISQSIGADKKEDAKTYIDNGFFMAFILAVIYSTIVIIFRKDVIGFFELGSADMERDAITYLVISMISVIFMYFNTMFVSIANSVGESVGPFKINVIGFIFNAVLDPLFIFGFLNIKGYGVLGAAIATLISRILVTALFLINTKRTFEASEKKFRFDIVKAKDVLILGAPYALQRVLFSLIGIIMAKIIASWGATAIAVQKIGVQIEAISFMTIAGLNRAMRTFVGQNYGAEKLDRIKEGYKVGLILSIIFGLITTVLLVFFSEEIFSVFLNEDRALSMGIKYLKIIGYSQVFMCIEIISGASFNGLGKTYVPSIISIIFTSLRIPLAIFLSRTALGLDGVWWTISISSIAKGILLTLLFLLYSKYKLNIDDSINKKFKRCVR